MPTKVNIGVSSFRLWDSCSLKTRKKDALCKNIYRKKKLMKGNILNHFQVKLPGSKTIILQGTSISMMW
jgi:hypothetical protein